MDSNSQVEQENLLWLFGTKYVGVTATKLNENININVRYWFKNSDSFAPGAYGILIPTNKWDDFCNLIDSINIHRLEPKQL